MEERELELFLDTGWCSEATLFIDDYVYWCEGYVEDSKCYFFVDRWKAQCINGLYYSYVDENNHYINEERIFEISSEDMEFNKKQFLIAPIFNNQSFWQVYKQIEWVDEGEVAKDN